MTVHASTVESRSQKAAYMRAYNEKNSDKVNAHRRAKYHVNPESVLAAQREYNKRDYVKERMRLYNQAYQLENGEAVKAQRSEYRALNVDKIRIMNSIYNEANKSSIAAQKSAAYYANTQKVIDRNRRWRGENPDKILAKNQRRRAFKAGVIVEHIETALIYERDGGICGICALPVEREKCTLDHIIPLFRKGDHVGSNVQIAHRSCNSSKGTRTKDEFNAVRLKQ